MDLENIKNNRESKRNMELLLFKKRENKLKRKLNVCADVNVTQGKVKRTKHKSNQEKAVNNITGESSDTSKVWRKKNNVFNEVDKINGAEQFENIVRKSSVTSFNISKVGDRKKKKIHKNATKNAKFHVTDTSNIQCEVKRTKHNSNQSDNNLTGKSTEISNVRSKKKHQNTEVYNENVGKFVGKSSITGSYNNKVGDRKKKKIHKNATQNANFHVTETSNMQCKMRHSTHESNQDKVIGEISEISNVQHKKKHQKSKVYNKDDNINSEIDAFCENLDDESNKLYESWIAKLEKVIENNINSDCN